MAALPALPLDTRCRRQRPASGVPKTKMDRDKDEQASVVKSMCRSYAHTTSKLLYAFTALNEQNEKLGDAKSINDALTVSSRADLMGQISSTLAASVECVLRSSELAMRTTVLRDLRARFTPKENPIMADKGTQISGKKKKTEKESDDTGIETKPARKSGSIGACDVTVGEEEAQDEAQAASQNEPVPSKQSAGSAVTVAIYERLKNWEAQKQRRLETERVREEDKTKQSMAPPRRNSTTKYNHVESVLKKEQDKKTADDSKLIETARQLAEEEQARAAAEARASHSESERARLAQDLETQGQRMQEVEHQLEQTRALVMREQQENDALRKAAEEAARLLEIEQALEGRTLESWPMIPNRKVLRVAESEEFDGRVSAEYRVKDMDSGEKGVSLLMGRNATTRTSEPQCVLFDPAVLSDLQAARWWAANRHRFSKRNFRVSSRASSR